MWRAGGSRSASPRAAARCTKWQRWDVRWADKNAAACPPTLLTTHVPLHRWLQLVREGGWQALFSGIEASLIGTTVSQGIYFYL